MPQDCAYGVFEVGMNHAGEIDALVRMVTALRHHHTCWNGAY